MVEEQSAIQNEDFAFERNTSSGLETLAGISVF